MATNKAPVFYETKGGKQVKVKPAKIKADIMKAHGWTAEQYRKQYDIFKNKLRAYEAFREASGAKVKKQSPLAVLYRQAKAMLREKSDYTPSLEMQRIQSFSAVSITKGQKLAKKRGSVYMSRRARVFESYTMRAFQRFIEEVPKAQEIVYGVPLTTASNEIDILTATGGRRDYQTEEVTINGITYRQIFLDGQPLWEKKPVEDPIKREEALKALADYVHAKQSPKGGQTFETGEQVGSDPAADDFDYEAWL